ncbi:MAG: zinc metalloprotease HtpX [Chlamydiae bacterium RIFCSPHIGHO2_12_FULL_49_11]|nr:MAG: zinc metalloprotease HtpX [Chlamydiae bacterium RIFCSPHIGHO2_12_FULL_49_11]
MGRFLKRILFFILLNFLIMITIGIIVHFFHLDRRVMGTDRDGLMTLLSFAAIWGFAGSFISLALSRWIARTLMGIKLIDENTANGSARLVLETVKELAATGGIRMPQVGIFDHDAPNAFATGPTKNRSLVAVSTGLLGRMSNEEIRGVLGHEMSHIFNGDMVTMTLLQGVVNTFSIFFSYLLAFVITRALEGGREKQRGGRSFLFYFLSDLFRIVFMILGMIGIAAYSRWREYRADRGSAELLGPGPMVAALRKLQAIANNSEEKMPDSVKALLIFKERRGMSLFATHPPLERRIQALETGEIYSLSR